MLGLALEGGGARGAYHIGVFKAYIENGYVFDGFAGTSIGSINAAIFAQGDFDKIYELWQGLTMDRLFDVDEKALIELGNVELNMSTLTGIKSGLMKMIREGGIDTSKMRAVLSENIDEKKVRAANKILGLVTVSIEEIKPYEFYLEQIPEGRLIDYLMASASFPGFKSAMIDNKPFVDGGLDNNCPINMLCDKGFHDIIAVRTLGPGRFKSIKKYSSANIKIIVPSDDLGNVMLFSHDKIEANIKLGYYDGLRAIKDLKGTAFYVKPEKSLDFGMKLLNVDDKIIIEAGKELGLPEMPPKRMLFEHIIPRLGAFLKLDKSFDYEDFVIAALEFAVARSGSERFKIYDFEELLNAAKSALPEEDEYADGTPPIPLLQTAITQIETIRAMKALIKGIY